MAAGGPGQGTQQAYGLGLTDKDVQVAPAPRTDQFMRAILAAQVRHPDLAWIVDSALRAPHLLDPSSPTVYLAGDSDLNESGLALLAGIATLDERSAGGQVIPLRGPRQAG